MFQRATTDELFELCLDFDKSTDIAQASNSAHNDFSGHSTTWIHREIIHIFCNQG